MSRFVFRGSKHEGNVSLAFFIDWIAAKMSTTAKIEELLETELDIDFCVVILRKMSLQQGWAVLKG
jgi:hypothetical protein